jgi:hypothetical protein
MQQFQSSNAPRRTAAGVALQTRAVADHGEIAIRGRIRRHSRSSALPTSRVLKQLVLQPRHSPPRSTASGSASLLPHAFEMKFNRVTDFLLRRVADGYAAGQIRNVGRVVPLALLDHDGVSHRVSP